MIHIVMLKLLSFVFIKKFIIRMIMIIVIIIVTCKQRKCHITQWIISKDLNPKLLRYNFLSYSAPYLKSFNYPTASYFTNLFNFLDHCRVKGERFETNETFIHPACAKCICKGNDEFECGPLCSRENERITCADDEVQQPVPTPVSKKSHCQCLVYKCFKRSKSADTLYHFVTFLVKYHLKHPEIKKMLIYVQLSK